MITLFQSVKITTFFGTLSLLDSGVECISTHLCIVNYALNPFQTIPDR